MRETDHFFGLYFLNKLKDFSCKIEIDLNIIKSVMDENEPLWFFHDVDLIKIKENKTDLNKELIDVSDLQNDTILTTIGPGNTSRLVTMYNLNILNFSNIPSFDNHIVDERDIPLAMFLYSTGSYHPNSPDLFKRFFISNSDFPILKSFEVLI